MGMPLKSRYSFSSLAKRRRLKESGGGGVVRSSSTDQKRSSTLQAKYEISYRRVDKLIRTKNKSKNGHTPKNRSQFGYWNESNIDKDKKFVTFSKI